MTPPRINIQAGFAAPSPNISSMSAQQHPTHDQPYATPMPRESALGVLAPHLRMIKPRGVRHRDRQRFLRELSSKSPAAASRAAPDQLRPLLEPGRGLDQPVHHEITGAEERSHRQPDKSEAQHDLQQQESPVAPVGERPRRRTPRAMSSSAASSLPPSPATPRGTVAPRPRPIPPPRGQATLRAATAPMRPARPRRRPPPRRGAAGSRPGTTPSAPRADRPGRPQSPPTGGRRTSSWPACCGCVELVRSSCTRSGRGWRCDRWTSRSKPSPCRSKRRRPEAPTSATELSTTPSDAVSERRDPLGRSRRAAPCPPSPPCPQTRSSPWPCWWS